MKETEYKCPIYGCDCYHANWKQAYEQVVERPNWHTRFSGFSCRKILKNEWVFVCVWKVFDLYTISRRSTVKLFLQCIYDAMRHKAGLLPHRRDHPGLSHF